MNNTQSIISQSGNRLWHQRCTWFGRRFYPEVCAAFTHAFVAVLRNAFPLKKLALAIDNRPSSYAMAQACAAALMQAGVEPIYYGVIPTGIGLSGNAIQAAVYYGHWQPYSI